MSSLQLLKSTASAARHASFTGLLSCLALLAGIPASAEPPEVQDIFQNPSLAIKQIGCLKAVPSSQISGSGISIGFECLDRFIFDPERCYDKLGATGVKWARCQTGWNRCETEKGKYDFRWLDDVVDNLRRRGVQPWFNVGYGNKLYMPKAYGEAAVGSVPLYYGEETLQAWKNYIRAMSRHFKGRVTHWEIWNEPNIGSFWQPTKPDPLEYIRLIKLTGAIIREEIPEAKIGACNSGVISPYVIRLIKSGVGKEIDFFCVHAYRVLLEKDYAAEIAALRRLFDANGGKRVRLWQGESGFASHFPKGHWLHPTVLDSERNQAKWLLRRFALDFRNGLERSSFFQMVDMTAKPYQMSSTTQTDPARHGILHGNSYEPKESYHAITHFAAVFDRDTVKTDLYASLNFTGPVAAKMAAVTTGFLRRGRPLYAYYLPEDVQTNYPGAADTRLEIMDDAAQGIEKPVLVDLLKGRVYEPAKVRRANGVCRVFERLPLTDYPLVITDREALRERIDFASPEH
ncbi:MAG: beta-galactosidase [Verrucomicrobiia bacterium]